MIYKISDIILVMFISVLFVSCGPGDSSLFSLKLSRNSNNDMVITGSFAGPCIISAGKKVDIKFINKEWYCPECDFNEPVSSHREVGTLFSYTYGINQNLPNPQTAEIWCSGTSLILQGPNAGVDEYIQKMRTVTLTDATNDGGGTTGGGGGATGGGGGGTAPNAPISLVASAIGPNINLTWMDLSMDETGFTIEKADDDGAGNPQVFAQIAQTFSDITTYTDNIGVTPGTTYHYRVKAYNGSGDSGYTLEESVTSNP